MTAAATPLIFATAIFATTFLGGLMPMMEFFKSEIRIKRILSLGTGLLIGLASLHMLPEAAELAPHSFGMAFLAGLSILYFLERFLMVHPCEEHACDYHTIGLTAFFGLTIHGLIEGVALASTLHSPALALVVLMGILVHKVPSGVTLSSLLHLAKKSQKQILLFVAGVSLAAPTGLLLAAYFMSHDAVSPQVSGVLLAASAGTFLYIATCDLLPELHHNEHDKWPRLALFTVGILIALVTAGHHH